MWVVPRLAKVAKGDPLSKCEKVKTRDYWAKKTRIYITEY